MHYLKVLGEHTEPEKLPSENELKTFIKKLAAPLSNYAEELGQIFDKEKTRRSDIINSIHELIEADLGKVSIIDPMLDLTTYEKLEESDIKNMIEALNEIVNLGDFVIENILQQNFDQQNIRNLTAEINVSVNKKTSLAIKNLAKVKLSRRLIEQSAEQALSDLSSQHWVPTELEWRDMLVPIMSDKDILIEDLMKDLIEKLKSENRYFLAPDALNLIDTSVELPKTKQQIEKEKQKAILEQEELEKEKAKKRRNSQSTAAGSKVTSLLAKSSLDDEEVDINDEKTKKEVEQLLRIHEYRALRLKES